MLTDNFITQNHIDRLMYFIETGGPEERDYDELNQIWHNLNVTEEGGTSRSLTKERSLFIFGDDFLNETAHGLSYRKPHGYSGDFEIIDNIYQQKVKDERFQKWDKYCYAHDACKAVRNRKSYFIELVKEKALRLNRPLRILNIASGPCRDILELFGQVPAEKLEIHCVEIDPNAIEYAKKLLGRFSCDIQFTRKNIFKFNTPEKFDLIWSGGLFDYFENDVFIGLLSRISQWCAPSGEIVLGNFSTHNPSKAYMEKCLDWHLFHRTGMELIDIALNAGFKNNQIQVRNETLGINLFLHISLA